MAADRFVITPRPPVRAFAVAALLAAGGAVVAVLPVEGALRVAVIVLGVLLIVAAAALLGAAFAASRRQQVVVELDEAGYRVDSPAGVRTGSWKDVTRVTTAPGRITLHQGADERVHLVAPQGQLPELDAIVKAVSEHLDADRGYTVWEG